MTSDWQQELTRYRMIDHALAYAKKGWRIFPVWWPSYPGVCACRDGSACTAAAKHPRIKDAYVESTTDEKELKRWWGKWPLANIGLATGPESGITVLDIDEYNGGHEAFGQLLRIHGRPSATVVSLTGGGGRHVFWKWKHGHRCRQGVRRGIDVRAGGGHVLLPPSIHVSGIRYAWHRDGHPGAARVAEAPSWVEALLTGFGHKEKREPLPNGEIAEGTRNRSLFRLACRWRRDGMDDEPLADRVHETNQQRCKPPLDDREVEKIISSALRYARGT